MAKKKTTRRPERAIVTFPLHIRGEVWERFRDALDKGESAHGVLLAFVEERARGRRKGRRQG